MTLRTREQAATAAEAVRRYDPPGMCQVFTRTMFGAPAVGDRDDDGDADAVDGWLSEPTAARHPGDRNPPRGVPVAFSGGSRGFGHRAVAVGGGRIRSTDIYSAGLVSTVTIAQVEAAMGVRYTGWTETCSGQVIPGGAPTPEPAKPPRPEKDDRRAFVVAHNAHVGSPASTMRGFLADEVAWSKEHRGAKPLAFVLTEVPHLFDELPALAAAHGYVVLQEKPGQRSKAPISEHGSTALLVPRPGARRAQLLRERVIVHDHPWTVFSGIGGRPTAHDPRRAPLALLEVADPTDPWRVKLLGDHWPTNGPTGGNAKAWQGCANRTAAVALASRPSVVVAGVGDHNTSLGEVRHRFPAADVAGARIDHGIVWNGSVSANVGPLYDSAGHPVVRLIIRPA